MEKLSMCRICLVENVRMFVVSNKNLQDIYETLTKIPLVTEDCRPMLTCYFCYSKLKQCCRFKRKCLEAEELFAQMLNSCEQKPLIKHGNSGPVGGLEKTPIESISIADGLPEVSESDALEVKVPKVPSVPAVTKTQYEFIEIKVEHQNDGLESEDVDHVPERHSSTDSEDDVPLFRIKTEEIDLEAEQVSRNLREAVNTDRAPETKKHKLEDKVTAEQKKTEKQGSYVIQRNPNHTIKPVYKLSELFTKNKPGTNYRFNKNRSICNIIKNVATDSDDDKIQEVIKERPFKCDMCHRSYTIRNHLKNHMRKHTGEKPFECEICHRSFAFSGRLKSHIETVHTDASKPFKCDICQRSFRLKNNLKTHFLTHTGEKPYKCHICQRAFTQKANLRTHILIHTGDRPFRCDVCNRSFTVKHSLARHIRVHRKYD